MVIDWTFSGRLPGAPARSGANLGDDGVDFLQECLTGRRSSHADIENTATLRVELGAEPTDWGRVDWMAPRR